MPHLVRFKGMTTGENGSVAAYQRPQGRIIDDREKNTT
jgi:hypothetical protein